MASVTYGKILRGLRDIKVTNIGGTVQEDLDAAQEMSFTPEYTTAQLRGDDVIKASLTNLSGGSASLTAGGYSSAAIGIMLGKTVTIAGSSPSETSTLQLNQGDSLPYFKVYALARDDQGGDLHLLMAKCKVKSMGALTFKDEEWFISNVELDVLDDGTNGVVKIIQHQTTAALPSS